MNSEQFEGLDGYWYLYYYYRRGTTSDYLTQRLDDLKDNKASAIAIFSSLCEKANLNSLGIKFDFIVRALGSNEITPMQGSRVAPLAKAIAKCVGAEYIPRLLKKTRKTQALKYLSKIQRKKEMHGAYAINTPHNVHGKNVLVVDDITTTGISFTEIARAIKEFYPTTKVYGFSLARTKTLGWFGAPKKNEDAWIKDYQALVT